MGRRRHHGQVRHPHRHQGNRDRGGNGDHRAAIARDSRSPSVESGLPGPRAELRRSARGVMQIMRWRRPSGEFAALPPTSCGTSQAKRPARHRISSPADPAATTSRWDLALSHYNSGRMQTLLAAAPSRFRRRANGRRLRVALGSGAMPPKPRSGKSNGRRGPVAQPAKDPASPAWTDPSRVAPPSPESCRSTGRGRRFPPGRFNGLDDFSGSLEGAPPAGSSPARTDFTKRKALDKEVVKPGIG